ncbi:Oidioi.mRNA.OKI2018_I69.chr1.g2572.t1.cds [Oikopleura dioica]|uniref:Oidioi.mRNA.OKI2018_I69.chr1.g2572.t1.cds n=1 Tax=Oikopleura dioica TaxID=34765 RepID=A0ABN7ST94_OIKDI|nr:Oidioi.mRNA.OKI2018_I69.chr1.g2572.t1.cds [Oikopleura dioica]
MFPTGPNKDDKRKERPLISFNVLNFSIVIHDPVLAVLFVVLLVVGILALNFFQARARHLLGRARVRFQQVLPSPLENGIRRIFPGLLLPTLPRPEPAIMAAPRQGPMILPTIDEPPTVDEPPQPRQRPRPSQIPRRRARPQEYGRAEIGPPSPEPTRNARPRRSLRKNIFKGDFPGKLADSLNIDNEAVGIIENLLLAETDDELSLHSSSEESDSEESDSEESEPESTWTQGHIVADSGEQYGLVCDASTQTADSGYLSLMEDYPIASHDPVFDTTPEISPIQPRLMRLNATSTDPTPMLIDIPDDVSLGTLFEGMIEPENQDYVTLEELVNQQSTMTPPKSPMLIDIPDGISPLQSEMMDTTACVTPPRKINRNKKARKPRCARRIFPKTPYKKQVETD